MSLSLRGKLALALALVAAVPLVAIEQATAWLVRREFADRTAFEFAASRAPLEGHFERQGERLLGRLHEAARDYALRDALLAFAAAPGGAAQRRLIGALGATAAELGLPLLTLYAGDGTVIASAQEPERFDVRAEAAVARFAAHPGELVLAREEGIAVTGLALGAALPVRELPGPGWLAGGILVDADFWPVVPPSSALVLVATDGIEAAPGEASHAARAIVAAAGGTGDPAEARRRLEERGFDVAALRLPAAPGAAALLLARSRAPLAALIRDLQWTFATLLGAGLAIAFLLAWLLSRRWTEPIRELVRGLDRVARGDLEGQVRLAPRQDELGRLVTAFEAMTLELRESREKLVQAERVAAWRDIARRLAHEIKNPLSPISLSMETLRRAYAARRRDFPELLAACTDTVLEEVERLRRIVQEFSDFARLPKPRWVEESFHEVVRGVVALYAAHGERHRFRLDLEPGDGRFSFDPDQMNRLLVNLVKNALEATPEGGEVRIATRRDGERFVITVEDSGPGVPAEVARRLFEPYTTTKQGGSGLGLAIVHRIVGEHGGSVRLVNPGEPGARFRVELPVTAPVGAGEGDDEVLAAGEPAGAPPTPS